MKKLQQLLEADHRTGHTGIVNTFHSLLSKWFSMPVVIIAYFVFAIKTGLFISCPFRTLTGLRCPGCGLTHMVLNLVKGHLFDAFACNPVFMVLFVYRVGIWFLIKLQRIRQLYRFHYLIERILEFHFGHEYIMCWILVIWGFVRNILGI